AGVPGLAYGVVLDGRLLYSGGFGLADLARGVPADARTVFRVASISKSVTALAVLQLRDAGRLELDAPVARYLSELEEQPLPSADAPAPTLRHLLTHTAGLPEDNAWGDRQLGCSDIEFSALLRAGISF